MPISRFRFGGAMSSRFYLPLHTPLSRFVPKVPILLLLLFSFIPYTFYFLFSLTACFISLSASSHFHCTSSNRYLPQCPPQFSFSPNRVSRFLLLLTLTIFKFHNHLLLFNSFLLLKNSMITILRCATGRAFLPRTLGLLLS